MAKLQGKIKVQIDNAELKETLNYAKELKKTLLDIKELQKNIRMETIRHRYMIQFKDY